jgi:hypothetical protein
MSNGKKWQQRRKIITPSFHFKILEQFAEIMDSQGKVFVANLKKREGQQVNFFPLISLYALDVICGNNKMISRIKNYACEHSKEHFGFSIQNQRWDVK